MQHLNSMSCLQYWKVCGSYDYQCMYPWQHLDNEREYGISGFGISVTTMEEVFIKVGEGSSELEDRINEGKKQCKLVTYTTVINIVCCIQTRIQSCCSYA